MIDRLIAYIVALIPLFVGAWCISNAAKYFVQEKYFMAGFEIMMSIWMICLFVKTFFNL